MRKTLCLILILSVIGGVALVSTGCGGGGGGGGFLKAFAVVLVIAAVASSGGAGSAAAFAANVKAKPVAAIFASARLATSPVMIRITPMNNSGTLDTAAQILLSGDQLSVDSTGRLLATYSMGTDATHYHLEVVATAANGTVVSLLKGVQNHTSGSEGQLSPTLNSNSTAQTLTYEKWVNTSGATDRSFENFVLNASGAAPQAAISSLATTIQNQFDTANAQTTVQDLSLAGNTTDSQAASAASTVGTASLVQTNTYSVSGYVTAADGVSGSQNTLMTLTSTTNASQSYTASTNNGNFSITGVPNGTYTLVPSKVSHTFTPSNRQVTVNSGNVTGQNFQAALANTQQVSVSITAQGFNQGFVNVSGGVPVVWTNNDSVAHTVTSDNQLFDSGNIQPGGTYSHTFQTPGIYGYHCNIHQNLTGEVQVQ